MSAFLDAATQTGSLNLRPRRGQDENRRPVLAIPRILEKYGTPEDDDQSKRSRASRLDELRVSWAESHEWYLRECAISFAFYRGDHFGYWASDGRGYVARPRPSRDSVRVTLPLIGSIVDMGVTLLTREPPQFAAMSATSEGRDAAASEAADALIEHCWRFHNLDDKYNLVAQNSFICGTAITHVQWDQSRGRHVQRQGPLDLSSPEAQELIKTLMDVEAGEEGISVDSFAKFSEKFSEPEGDVTFEVLTPEEVVPDPASRGDQDGAGIFVVKRFAKSVAVEMYPGADWTGADDQARDGEERVRTIERTTHGGGYSSVASDDGEDTVTVSIFYMRASSDFPVGYMAVFSDTAMIYEGDNPVYPNPEKYEFEGNEMWPRVNWPLVAHRHNLRANSYWGAGAVMPGVSTQKSINGAWSKAIQHCAKLSNAKVRMPTEMDVEWNDTQGQVIRVPSNLPTSAVGYVLPPPLDHAYTTIIEMGHSKLEFILGVNRASAGAIDGETPSGRALLALQQQDLGRLFNTKRRLDTSFSEVMRQYVSRFRRHVDVERTISITGLNKATSVRALDRAALGGGTDVWTINDQSVPRDPTQRILFMVQLAQNGAIDLAVPSEKEMFFQLLGLRDVKGFIRKQNADLDKATRQNLQIMEGHQVQIDRYDDLLTHRVAVTSLRKSEEYEIKVRQQIAEMGRSPTAEACQAKLDALDEIEQKQQQEMMAAQAAAQAAANGQPTPPAQPPAPSPEVPEPVGMTPDGLPPPFDSVPQPGLAMPDTPELMEGLAIAPPELIGA